MTVPARSSKWRLRVLLAIAAGTSCLALFWGSRIQQAVVLHLLIRTDAPESATVNELIEQSASPLTVVQLMWQTGKIAHRQQALVALREVLTRKPELAARAEGLLVAAAMDVDLSARELAFGMLAGKKNTNLLELALAQLTDVDPLVRLLGLQYIAREQRRELIPVLVHLLDDSEPQIVTTAAVALRRLTGNDFGIRIAQSFRGYVNNETGELAPLDATNERAILDGVQRWKAWWQTHQTEFPISAAIPLLKAKPLAVLNLTLTGLDGRRHRLSEFRGKMVLLHFWTTWCSACFKDIPGLNELQRLYPDQLVVLGVSLDGVPDEHGHNLGISGTLVTETEMRSEVEKFVAKRSIRYPIFVDPSGRSAAALDGQELPTNVLLDSGGRVRRRFIGGRSFAVMEAMLRELTDATNAARKQSRSQGETSTLRN